MASYKTAETIYHYLNQPLYAAFGLYQKMLDGTRHISATANFVLAQSKVLDLDYGVVSDET
jgi:hypothetical protein